MTGNVHSIFCRVRIKVKTCLSLTTKTGSVGQNVQRNSMIADDIENIHPRGARPPLVVEPQPSFTAGTRQLLSVEWFGACLVGLQSFQCDGLSADGCWPRDSLSTERNNEVLSSRTLVAFLPNPPLYESTPPRILNKIESGFGLSQKRGKERARESREREREE